MSYDRNISDNFAQLNEEVTLLSLSFQPNKKMGVRVEPLKSQKARLNYDHGRVGYEVLGWV